MPIEGKRLKKMRLIQTDRFVVVVEVEMVVPTDDPGEACYEPQTVKFLKEVREKAETGDLGWLKRHGKVYEALTPEAVA